MIRQVLGSLMKSLSTCLIAAAGLIGTPAFAADMAVKAPLLEPVPLYDWTGWYAGVNVGASFGHVKTDLNITPITVGAPPVVATVPGFASSNTSYPSGFMGGGQIGYNWQFSPTWVAGLETDFQGSLERDNNNFTTPFSTTVTVFVNGVPLVPPVPATGTAVTNYTTQIDWFGTVRGRMGYLWGNGQVLSYVTGGFAYGKVNLEGTNTVSGSVGFNAFSVSHAIGHSQVNTGWTVGFGTEGRLANSNWTWKVEALYLDLGHIDDTDAALPATGHTITHTNFNEGLLRGGLNYQFPSQPAPISTRG